MKLGITMLIHNKDDVQFVTEFPCLLEHPVLYPTGWADLIFLKNVNQQIKKRLFQDRGVQSALKSF